MPTTRKYAVRSRGIVRELNEEKECVESNAKRNLCLAGLDKKCKQYIAEIEMLSALPNLSETQKSHLSRLEIVLKNMQGTLQKSR